MITLAIVSPCYNEEEVLETSSKRLMSLLDGLIKEEKISPDSMIVFVNDGSKDHTWEIIRRLQAENRFVRGINLAYNVGHQNAIMAGMMTAKGWADAVITIDADLQDDLQAIPKMIDCYAEGSDIVYGVKISRKADPVLKRFTAVTFYKLQERMGVKSVFNHADFRLMSRRALDMLAGYRERNLYLRGLIPMLGIIIGIYVLHALIAGTAYPGWASIMLSIWLIGGFILLSIGVVGIYVGKIYVEVKNRPLYNISEIIGDEHRQV